MDAHGKIWMDGAFIEWADAKVHVLTHSLHYGLAAFEGLRCYKGKSGSAIFKLQEHVDRLFESAHIGMMTIPYEKKQVADAIVDTVRINKLEACYIRPLVYIGYGAMGVYPGDNPIKLAIAAWKWGSYLGDDALANGMRACVSSFTRHHVNVSMTRGKISGYYVNSILAKREAKANGYDEAILLDPDGYVSEGTGENIFIVRKGRLKTTPLTSILEGITRNAVIELAREQGIVVRVRGSKRGRDLRIGTRLGALAEQRDERSRVRGVHARRDLRRGPRHRGHRHDRRRPSRAAPHVAGL